MKIHIIGCSGSGKTYLAQALSKKYNIPHFDLDDIQWDNRSGGYGTKTPVEKRTELLNHILENDNWIIEGVYYAWVSIQSARSLYRADKKVYVILLRRAFGGHSRSFVSVYGAEKCILRICARQNRSE